MAISVVDRRLARERRDLTALFCDVVDYVRLFGDLDDEEIDEVTSDFYAACEEVIKRFDGNIVEELGDGLLVYFGWPVAHEDDPRRAVSTGLSLVRAIQELNVRLTRDKGIALRVRIGIDTGSVVVSELKNGRKAVRAVGTTPNIAFRLQGVAEPDTVVISRATHDLVRGYFIYDKPRQRRLRHFTDRALVYRVLAESGAANRVDTTDDHGLVGRDTELNRLLELWDAVNEGPSKSAEISGEPGIGKSRLVKAICEHVPNRIEFRCSRLDSHSALFPVIKGLERQLELDQLKTAEERRERLEHRLTRLGLSVDDIALISAELSLPLPDRYEPPTLPPQEMRRRTLNAFVVWFLKEADRQPLMAVWEDLHWADPSTIELLGQTLERSATSLLTVMTYRPDEFQPPWNVSAALTEIPLTRLPRGAVEEMIARITSGEPPLRPAVVSQIVAKAEGVPLFVEELLHHVVDSALPDAIPATLKGGLLSRLDRLGAAKAVAQRSAVLGRSFSQETIRAVLEAHAATDVERAEAWQSGRQCLMQLVEAGILDRRQARQTTYEFKHALIHEAAYESLLLRDRRRHNLQTAQVLETLFPRIAESQPEVLAHHYHEAQRPEQALEYWQKAGERARDRSANKEALHHFSSARKELDGLPESDARDRRELTLLVASLTPLIAVDGYVAETTVKAVDRALALGRRFGEKIGDIPGLFPVLYVQWVTRLVRGEYSEALRLSEDFLREAEGQTDNAPRLMSHRLRGFSIFVTAAAPLRVAHNHLKAALELYDEQRDADLKTRGYGQDPRCACEAFLSLVQWLRGDAAGAVAWSRKALDHGKASNHSNTWGYVLCFGGATFDVFRGDVASVRPRASELLRFAEKEGLPVWLAYARVLEGWGAARTGQPEEGLARMMEGLADFDYPSGAASALLGRPSQGMGFLKSFFLYLLADVHARQGRATEALAVLDTAWSVADTSGEGFWKAEIKRLTGELLLQPSDGRAPGVRDDAAGMFRIARELAQEQGALVFELRAAVSLGQLLGSEDATVRDTLLDVYRRCQAAGVADDLLEARALLVSLGAIA